jgi:molybdopterin synthase sulfur carrier subunit
VSVTVLYFAALRDAAGRGAEVVDTPADLATLYAQLRARHGFAFAPAALRVAVDGEFVRWDTVVPDGAEVAFIPPVSGG